MSKTLIRKHLLPASFEEMKPRALSLRYFSVCSIGALDFLIRPRTPLKEFYCRHSQYETFN